jgi:hypothetical protein
VPYGPQRHYLPTVSRGGDGPETRVTYCRVVSPAPQVMPSRSNDPGCRTSAAPFGSDGGVAAASAKGAAWSRKGIRLPGGGPTAPPSQPCGRGASQSNGFERRGRNRHPQACAVERHTVCSSRRWPRRFDEPAPTRPCWSRGFGTAERRVLRFLDRKEIKPLTTASRRTPTISVASSFTSARK